MSEFYGQIMGMRGRRKLASRRNFTKSHKAKYLLHYLFKQTIIVKQEGPLSLDDQEARKTALIEFSNWAILEETSWR